MLLSILQQRPQWAAELLPMVQQSQISDVDWLELLTLLSQKHKNISASVLLAEFYASHAEADQAEKVVTDKLKQQPNIRLFKKFIQLRRQQSQGDVAVQLVEIEQLVQAYLDTKVLYHCRNCGFKTRQQYWLCPSCQQWETVEPLGGIDGR